MDGKVLAFHRDERDAKEKFKHWPDYALVGVVVFLVLAGLMAIFTSSYYAEGVKEAAGDGNMYDTIISQVIFSVLGAGALLACMFLDYHLIVKFKWVFLIGSVALLGLTITGLGTNLNGSSRWLRIGGMSIQPSELIKFALIIFIPAWIAKTPRIVRDLRRFIIPLMSMLGVITVIMLRQPNLSAVICSWLLVLIMIVVGGANLKHLAIMGAMLLGVGIIALMLDDDGYKTARLTSFADPFNEKNISDSGYQVVQSLYSIASGGLFGRGPGNSMQKMSYLPYSDSDFIFAIVAEEFGLIGAAILLGAFALFIWRGTIVAMKAPDLLGKLIATGVVGIVGLQVIINVAVVTGTLPPTGVALPFISSGGTSIIVFLALSGLLLNISRHSRQ